MKSMNFPSLVLQAGLFPGLVLFLVGCVPSETATSETVASTSGTDRFPQVEIVNVFKPDGESNVRSSFRLADGVGLIGTEETGDVYKTEDAGLSWRKTFDGGEAWEIADVRNFIRGRDGHLYITTTEPATIARSTDEGESWAILAEPRSSRTVGLVELDSGVMLAGLRRSENNWSSVVRSEDRFDTFDWLPVSTTEPRQNVTCFGYWGGSEVLAGIGYEGPGKIYKSTDQGITWVKKAEFPDARDLMGFFRHGSDTYVLASGVSKLYRSSDGGETWSEARQFWSKGFLGECIPFEWEGVDYWLMSATDQSAATVRHLVLITDDPAGEWTEWIELIRDASGGASNLTALSEDTIVVGTGNHSAQGRAFTLKVGN
jgi:photosystem II stability/assembly factor-like uncharacterized protein